MTPAKRLPYLLLLLLHRGAGAEKPAGPATPVPVARPAKTERGPCTQADVQKARAEFRVAEGRKDYQAAANALTALLDRCSLDSDLGDDKPNLSFFWVRSDLSFALYKLGRNLDCLRLLAPLTTPKPPDSLVRYNLEEEKVGKAISYNEDQCQAAFDRQFAAFSKVPCRRGKTDGTAIALAKGVAPPGAADACLEMGPAADFTEFKKAEQGEGDPDQTRLCPHMTLWSQQKSGGPWRKVRLKTDGGPLSDPSLCCNLSELSAALVDGKRLVRVQGGGRNCFGGTADSREDAVYEWTGKGLLLQQSNDVVSH